MKLGILFLLALAFQGPTEQSITHTYVAPPHSTIISETWNVPLFDAKLGTLTRVVLESDWKHGRVVAQESECSNAQDPLTLQYNMSAQAMILRNGQPILLGTDHQITELTTYGPYDGVTDFAGTSGDLDRRLYVNTTTQEFTDPVDLATFIGRGKMDVGVIVIGGANYNIVDGAGCAGGYTAMLRQRLMGTFRVTYFYN